MGDLFMAAIAALAFVVLVALLWSNQKREKENYLTEGMCLGLALGAGLAGVLHMELGQAMSLGMLLGAALGQLAPKGGKEPSETTEKEDSHEDS